MPALRAAVVAALVVASALAKEGCTRDDKSYDVLLLVQSWPNSCCQREACQDDTFGSRSVWTMHGLWPSRIGDEARTYPCECDSRSFDESQVAPIKDKMDEFWPSENGGSASFWAHEWMKHGTCSSDVTSLQSELGFFKTTLALRQARDVRAALDKASIVPSSGRSYSKSVVAAALKPITGFVPLLGCIFVDGTQYLHEVSFCLSKSLQDIECDPSIVHLSGDETSNCEDSEKMVLVPPSGQRAALVV